jgi:uncharacterized damage-inducible protein DinB
MPNEHLQRLFRHNLWASRLITEACRDLSQEQLRANVHGTYGELGRTLAHIAAGEAYYVSRFDQETDRFQWDEEDPVPPIATIANVLDKTGARLVMLAGTTPEDRILSYMIEGEERRWPAWVILGQAIDHGREHRSHVATILTQLGIEPPVMDMWTYGTAVQAGEAD